LAVWRYRGLAVGQVGPAGGADRWGGQVGDWIGCAENSFNLP
jgi:hypothetical protein